MADEGILTMTVKERELLQVVQALIGRRLSQREAAEELGLTVRQIKRQLAGYRQEGVMPGVAPRRRGAPGNRGLSASVWASALAHVRQHCADLGPTQFGSALEALEIDHIAARSPQPLGGVERANKTLQDRLVKALRWEPAPAIPPSRSWAQPAAHFVSPTQPAIWSARPAPGAWLGNPVRAR